VNTDMLLLGRSQNIGAWLTLCDCCSVEYVRSGKVIGVTALLTVAVKRLLVLVHGPALLSI
jgi:hypothetical protein